MGHLRCPGRLAAALAMFSALGWAGLGAGYAQAGEPIRVGGTLALTGPLAPTAIIHKLAGEAFIERQNARGGWLGRPIQWVLLDDQSKPEQTKALYERLITVDKVDLLMGPYGTGTILAAMGVADRYNKVFVHHTFGMPHLATTKGQFPAFPMGPEPAVTFPLTLYTGLKSVANPPKTVAVVTNKFPSAHFFSQGARDQAAKHGIKVALYLEYDFGTNDFTPIAARLREAKADFVWVGAVGLDANLLLEAMQKINYRAPGIFFLFPAPGPLLALGKTAEYAMALSPFEEHPPFTDDPEVGNLVKGFHEKAAAAGVKYRDVDMQAAASYSAWQMLGAAVEATQSLDDEKLIGWLKKTKVKAMIGTLRFDGKNNYGDDLQKVKQIRDGKWVVVWPPEFAKPGLKLVYPAP